MTGMVSISPSAFRSPRSMGLISSMDASGQRGCSRAHGLLHFLAPGGVDEIRQAAFVGAVVDDHQIGLVVAQFGGPVGFVEDRESNVTFAPLMPRLLIDRRRIGACGNPRHRGAPSRGSPGPRISSRRGEFRRTRSRESSRRPRFRPCRVRLSSASTAKAPPSGWLRYAISIDAVRRVHSPVRDGAGGAEKTHAAQAVHSVFHLRDCRRCRFSSPTHPFPRRDGCTRPTGARSA